MAERLTISDIRQHQRMGGSFHPRSYSASLEDTALAALAKVESLQAQLATTQAENRRLLDQEQQVADAMWRAQQEMEASEAFREGKRVGYADCFWLFASELQSQRDEIPSLRADLAAVRTDLSVAREALRLICTEGLTVERCFELASSGLTATPPVAQLDP